MNPAQTCAAVRATMQQRGMDDFASGPILVAVSGGADSLTLMHVLHRLGYAVEVAHFNHRARPGSDKDAPFVAKEAAKLGLAFHSGAREEPALAGESPEAGMRRHRLAYLERVAATIGASRIATGHTKDDQAETVMMRVVGGAGRRGLAGIPPVRGPYVRPLIDLQRADTEAFCRALRVKPLRDPSNDDQSLRRNAVRHDLLPAIRQRYNARIDDALARGADVLRDEEALLDQLAADALSPDAAGGTLRLDAAAIALLHPALQRRVIRRAAPLDADHTERVRRLALDGRSGDRIDLPGGVAASLEYGWLVLGRAPEQSASRVVAALDVPGTTDLPGWWAHMRATVVEHAPDPLPDGVAACAIDASRCGERMTVRGPKAGDRFRPLGMRGDKKLGDFLTDAKVPRPQRPSTPVVTSESGIIWVVGHRIDERCKVTKNTKRVLVLEWAAGAQRGGLA